RGRAALQAQLHACCEISQDRAGHVHDYQPRSGGSCACGATPTTDE
ncbi:sigma-70 family RNA polymerase sigma factor, partial [Rhodococcus koreensis]